MSPLSFLSVPIFGSLPLSKAAKWTRIIWGFIIILVYTLAYKPPTYNGSLIQDLQVMRL